MVDYTILQFLLKICMKESLEKIMNQNQIRIPQVGNIKFFVAVDSVFDLDLEIFLLSEVQLQPHKARGQF